ncbi:MAG: DUF1963 domain-containing protein, partial [Nocardioides sp.]|nr:DUF1963 domain-containing protein [Nocardioides sp.]
MTARTAMHLAELAATHLDPDTARRWLALLRPAVQLVQARPGDRVVARLGGTPELPLGTDWPQWPGHGPLSFVAEVDLAAPAAPGGAARRPQPAGGGRRGGTPELPRGTDWPPGPGHGPLAFGAAGDLAARAATGADSS